MEQLDRFYTLHKVLSNRRTPISRRQLELELGISRATVKRLISKMRIWFDAPVSYSHKRNGYYYDIREDDAPFELPGLWFNSDELFALLSTQYLLKEIQPGLLADAIAPFQRKLKQLLHARPEAGEEIDKRVRILQTSARATDPADFRKIGTALVQRQRINIVYQSRGKDQLSERLVSPQRLVYYRDNWYLDAWCHEREALRTFSLDRLKPVWTDAKTRAKDVSDDELDHHYARSYGIFAGPVSETAKLHFSPRAARWVADEHWHPQQQGKIMSDGAYELQIPYGDPTELVRDILKYGAEVEVLSPPSLRAQVKQALQAALAQYK